MNQRKTLSNYIRRARRSLMIEKALPIFQYGLLTMVVVCALVLLVSRLFVFPYYGDVTMWLAVGILLLTIIYIWIKRVRYKEALMKLDEYYPNNELVTSLSFEDGENPLVKSLLQKAEKASEPSYQSFKQRKKKFWRPTVLISILITSILIGLLVSFPSETQREAVAIEKENEIVKELKKEIEKIEKKTISKENKKELEDLRNKLKDVDSAEKALREVVKKQKELQLQEQKLQQELEKVGENGELTSEQKEQLKELVKMQNELNDSLLNTKSQLSKFGKPLNYDLQNEIASLSGSNSSSNQNNNKSNNSNQNSGNNSNQNNNGSGSNNNQSNSNNSNNGNSGNNGNNGNNGNSGNNGNNGNNGNGNGQGTGQGNGNGNGNGGGQGSGGSKGGYGQGTRDLLAIPKRIGEKGEVTTDSGPLGTGDSNYQKGKVNATKGTIRPYGEVIGDYRNSYFESSARMQLPKDLQSIVQSYFSSIEDD